MKNYARTTSARTVPEMGNYRGKRNPVGQKGDLLHGKARNSFVHAALQTNDREALRNEQESMNKSKSAHVEAW